MGMREREQAAIRSAINERLMGGAGFDDLAESMRNPGVGMFIAPKSTESDKNKIG